MRRIMFCAFVLAAFAVGPVWARSPALGAWYGVLETPAGGLRLLVRIRAAEDGTLAGDLESLDQAPGRKFPLSAVHVGAEALEFEIPALGASFAGRFEAAAARWVGDFRQGGAALPLVLERKQEVTATPRRPQTPTPPFPYRVEEVRIPNPEADGVVLAGTLTLPPGDGAFPAAILISGSGPQDRDETLFGHKPFLVIADYLTRHGIAVLRYDDRGVGESGGDFANATSADFASDARAAAAFLRRRPGIRADAVGFIGHSEGGLVGGLAAGEDPHIAYLVLLAGPGLPGIEILQAQNRFLLESQGRSEAEIARLQALNARILKAVAAAPDAGAARVAAGAILTAETRTALGLTDAASEKLVAQLASPWFRYFLRTDPAAILASIDSPVLALNGALDRQVPAAANLAAIARALSRNGDVTAQALPGLNHLFQHARTGVPAEYAGIEETFAGQALALIADWIRARF